jgi:hypothetical protein
MKGTSYIQQNEEKAYWIVTSCVGMAFYVMLLQGKQTGQENEEEE